MEDMATWMDRSKLAISSRWEETTDGSLISGWSGSTIQFLFTGSALSVKIGPQTERKDRWNGGTPMIGVSMTLWGDYTSSNSPTTSDLRSMKTFDPAAGAVISLRNSGELQDTFLVVITLIDWASLLEVEFLLVNIVSASPTRVATSSKGIQAHCGISRTRSSSVLPLAPMSPVFLSSATLSPAVMLFRRKRVGELFPTDAWMPSRFKHSV